MNLTMDEHLKMVDSVFTVMIIWRPKLLFLLKKVPSNYLFIQKTPSSQCGVSLLGQGGTLTCKKKISDVTKPDAGDLYYRWSDNKLYKCTVVSVNGR